MKRRRPYLWVISGATIGILLGLALLMAFSYVLFSVAFWGENYVLVVSASVLTLGGVVGALVGLIYCKMLEKLEDRRSH